MTEGGSIASHPKQRNGQLGLTADVWSSGLIQALSRDGTTLNERFYCLKDQLDPVAICDTTGTVQERYFYTAFGTPSYMAGDYSSNGDSTAYAWTFLFHAEFLDLETDWMNYGYRYYSPLLGRWLSRDPLSKGSEISTYLAFDNCPPNWLDIVGLSSFPPPGAQGPVQAFSTSDSAAHAGLNEAKQMTRDSDTKANSPSRAKMPLMPSGMFGNEYWGLICYQKCNGKTYYATTGPISGTAANPNKGDAANCNPDLATCPDGWTKWSEYHSHPGQSDPGTADFARVRGANLPAQEAYVGSASGLGPDIKYSTPMGQTQYGQVPIHHTSTF